MDKTFVYASTPLKYSHTPIQQYEVGILLEKNETSSVVQFVSQNAPITVPSNLVIEFNPAQTGDQYDKKICNVCNRLLPIDNFQKNQNGKNNRTVRRPSCNDCRDIIDGVSLSAKDKRDMERIKPNYEIWECPICGKRTIPGLTSKVVLDHDHSTGKPREWICDSCNTGLGRFKDNVKLIERAIAYLHKFDND